MRPQKTKLRQWRMRRFLTGVELAELMGMTPGAISNQERKGIRTISTAQRYASILHCRPQDLLEWGCADAQVTPAPAGKP